jgi:hypothetical protein
MSTASKLTLKGVQAELRNMNIILTKVDGEYRVNFRGGSEATAGYDTDLASIRDTGIDMARRLNLNV